MDFICTKSPEVREFNKEDNSLRQFQSPDQQNTTQLMEASLKKSLLVTFFLKSCLVACILFLLKFMQIYAKTTVCYSQYKEFCLMRTTTCIYLCLNKNVLTLSVEFQSAFRSITSNYIMFNFSKISMIIMA